MIQSGANPAASRGIALKPTHPQKFEFLRTVVYRPTTSIHHIDMEDPNNPGIQEWMLKVIFVLGKDYYVTVRGGRIDCILLPSNVVHCVIDMTNVVHVDAIILE
jgi:hypothetical protein